VSKLLKDAIATFDELVRMHQLNQELLNTLIDAMVWIRTYAKNHDIPLPKQNQWDSLLEHANCLIKEILNGHSPLLRHRRRKSIGVAKSSDEFLHGDESDEDFTEPPCMYSLGT